MFSKKLLISVGLTLWVISVFVGRWSLMTSSDCNFAVERNADSNRDHIENTDWMAFGLAVQEMSYQCTSASCRERWNEGNELRTKEIGLWSCVWDLRKQICEKTRKIVSSKRLINYYVFGLCKLLN